MRRRLLAIAFALLAAFAHASATMSRAEAQTTAEDLAAELVEVGTRAAAAGEYAFAAHAFHQAYGATLRPDLLFSIADVERRRWTRDRAKDALVEAIASYRRYLWAAPSGRHRDAAERALRDLETLARDQGGSEAVTEPAAPAARPTRLAILASVSDATATIDGGPARALPAFVELAPGRHEVVVRADGYADVVRRVDLRKGMLYPLRARLEPKPAKLAIDATAGATIHVDGKRVGVAPLEKPLELDAGSHFVAVSRTGFVSQGREVVLERGRTTKLGFDLEATRQRTISWALIGGGAAGIAGGIGFGIASVVEHRLARDIQRRSNGRQLDEQKQREHDAAIAARDDYRVVSGISAGIGLGLFLVGGTLLVIDPPTLPAPPSKTERAGGRGRVRVTAAPVVAPDRLGSRLELVF